MWWLQFRCRIPGNPSVSLPTEAAKQVRPHCGPFLVEDAVPGRVASDAAADEHVLAMDALELRRQRRHRAAGALIAGVRLQLDPEAAEPLEGVLEHQQLRLDVHTRPPGGWVEPRPADLEAPVLRPQREVAGAPEYAAV